MIFCVYCLAGARRMASSLTEYRSEDIMHKIPPMPVRDLVTRLDAIGEKDPDVIFYLSGMPYAFTPVATWHGDPVCEWHLLDKTSER